MKRTEGVGKSVWGAGGDEVVKAVSLTRGCGRETRVRERVRGGAGRDHDGVVEAVRLAEAHARLLEHALQLAQLRAHHLHAHLPEQHREKEAARQT